MKKNESRAKQFLRGLLTGQSTLSTTNLDVSLVVDRGENEILNYGDRHKVLLGGDKCREISHETYEKLKVMEKEGRVKLWEITFSPEAAPESLQNALTIWNSFQP